MHLSKQTRRGAKGRAAGAGGFTLIETAIAMVIMMVAGLSAVSLFVYSMRNNSLASTRLTALATAQQRIERLRNTPFDDAALAPGTTNETLSVGNSSYTVQTTICATADCGGSDTLKRITMQVAPLNGNNRQIGTSSAVVLTTERAALTVGPNLQ